MKDEIEKINPGAVIQAVITDNGKNYTTRTKKGKLNHLFEKTLCKFDIKHLYPKIRTPKTNGKVENAHWLYDKELFKKIKFSKKKITKFLDTLDLK